MVRLSTPVVFPVLLWLQQMAVPIQTKLVEISVGVFVETTDDDMLALLNKSLTDRARQQSQNKTSIRYHMTPDVTHIPSDTYSLTSRVCRMTSRNTSLLFSLLSCEAIPALTQVALQTDLPLISWTRCIGQPGSDWLVSMTSPRITIQTVIKRLVVRLKWRRLVFIYDNSADPRIVTGIIEQLRVNHVIMMHMTSSDMEFGKKSDLWSVEENYLVYCANEQLYKILHESRINRFDFIGPRYRWLLLDQGSINDRDLLQRLVEGDNVAIVRPAVDMYDEILSKSDVLNEVLSNLSMQGYDFTLPSCPSSIGNHSNNITDALKSSLSQVESSPPYSIWTYLQQPAGGMGFTHIGDVTSGKKVRLYGSLFPQLTQGYNNRTFVVSTIEYEPFMMNRDGKWVGLLFDLMDELAESMNFSYVVREGEDGTFGRDTGNGSFNGMVGAIQRKEVDFGVGPFTITHDREIVLDFTTPYWDDAYIILIRRPDPGESKTFICLGPFSVLVWIIIMLSVVVVSVILWLSLNYYPGPNARKPTTHGWSLLSITTWQTFGALMQQGMVEEPIVTSARVIVSMWWFYVIVIAGVYNGNLIAFLTAPITKLPITSLNSLAQSDMVFGTLRDAALHDILEKAEDGVYKTLWNKVKDNVDGLFPRDSNDGLNRVLADGKYAYIVENSFYGMLHAKNTSLREDQCKFARPSEEFLSNMYGLAFQKGSPYTSAFSLQLLRILESGLLHRIKNKWLTGTTRCTGLERMAAQTNISLREAQGAFYILGIGLTASLLILVVENLSKSRCWTYQPGFYPPPSRELPTTASSHAGSGDIFADSISHVPGIFQLPMVEMDDVDQNWPEVSQESDDSHQQGVPEVHQNGSIPNGTGHHQAEVLIHANDVLSYVDIFTGEVKRSNLVYERKCADMSKTQSLPQNSSSANDRDVKYAIRRRASVHVTPSHIGNGRVIRDKSDAETGEVIIEPVSDVSYL